MDVIVSEINFSALKTGKIIEKNGDDKTVLIDIFIFEYQ